MTAFSLEPEQLARCAELRTLAAERIRPLAEKGEPGRVNRALVAEGYATTPARGVYRLAHLDADASS